MSKLFTLPKEVILSNAGALIPGAQAYFFEAGTATPLAVYTDYTLGTAHSHPVVADGDGRFAAIYYDPDDDYKVTITDVDDVEIYSEDFVATIDDPLTGSEVGAALYPKTAAETSANATIVNDEYPEGHALRYGTNTTPLTTDMTTAIQTAINVASWSGRRAYIPAGDYLYTQLYLYYDSTNNLTYNSTSSKSGPLIIEGDGSMHINHVTNGVTAGTYLQSSETTNNTVLLAIPEGGDTANQGRIQIRDISFRAGTSGYVLQLDEFQDESLLEDVFVYNSGAGGGITMSGWWFAEFRRVLVLGQHTGFNRKPTNCTGIGWRLQGQGGSHSIFEHCSARGFDIAYSVGDSGTAVKQVQFRQCQAIASNYGWVVNVECEGVEIQKCNAELMTYRAILTVGAVEGFRVEGGSYIGTVSEWIASQVYSTNDAVHNDSGNIYLCTSGGTSAGAGGPTGTGTGITDNTCTWDFEVASAETEVSHTIELDTASIAPVIEDARIRVPEGGSGIRLVEDNSMNPRIYNNVFGVDFSGVTTGVCIDASTSTTAGAGEALFNTNLGAIVSMFDTPFAFNKYYDPALGVIQERVRTTAIAATVSVGNNRFVVISGNGTNITALSPTNSGQEVILRLGTAGATIEHSATLNLNGDANWTTTNASACIHLWCDGTNWYEIGRAD